MMSKYFLIIPIFFLFSCKKEDFIIKSSNDIKKALATYDSIYLLNEREDKLNFDKSYIFKSMYEGNQHAYSDLLLKKNGNFLLSCARAKQITDFTRQDIVFVESIDSGKTWKDRRLLAHSGLENYINASMPSLINLSDNHILLFYSVKYSDKRIDMMKKESFDGGKNWTDDVVVYKSDIGYQTVNNNRVLYVNGRLFIPIAITNNPNDLNESISKNMSIYLLYSDDLGKTWSKTENIKLPGLALLEPGIEYLGGDELLMNIRLNIGSVLFARSKDFGLNWTFEVSDFASPSSPQKILRINETGDLLIVWNNTLNNPAKHWGNRSPLSIAISKNKGKTWEFLQNLESDLGFDYSYPSMTQDKQNVYITYYELNQSVGYAIKLIKFKKSEFIK
ncbi:sialidase family protein [Sphingobacterium daejeonense]|uniref:sialidase family protein n=1 Tax=Sphingobacterium daejeonense TaxID=371142 RepID=UPI003D312896